ncbi:MAG: GTP-binding protein [Woeseiaceae bacterium]|nr:GTP-binding protein [Woeseiaceae bacterium]
MKRLTGLLWLVLAGPVCAGPDMTVLVPVGGAMSPQAISDAFRGNASVAAALPGSPIADTASSLYRSDVALLVLDATHGTLPQNREHVVAARQAGVPHVAVLITNVDALFDAVGAAEGPQLLALWEQEIRTLLELYGVGGAETPVYHDSGDGRRRTATMAGDLAQLVSDLRDIPSGGRSAEKLQLVRAAAGEVYLLTHEETNGAAITIDTSRTLELWIGGRTTTATIEVAGVAAPGDFTGFRLRSHSPLPAAAASRLLFVDDGRIVGIGVITKLALN